MQLNVLSAPKRSTPEGPKIVNFIECIAQRLWRLLPKLCSYAATQKDKISRRNNMQPRWIHRISKRI